MAVEIERKFLVVGEAWRRDATRTHRLRQAYLASSNKLSVRARIEDGVKATLTIKTAAAGMSRAEFEYPIPVADAEALMAEREGAIVEKVRHIVPMGDLAWEIDEFEGENAGLVVAELELDRTDRDLARPAWLGAEITGERRYYNADLARLPFARWR